jgi:hypothetical protein
MMYNVNRVRPEPVPRGAASRRKVSTLGTVNAACEKLRGASKRRAMKGNGSKANA